MAKSNKAYTHDEQERIDAVNRYHGGERPSKICKSDEIQFRMYELGYSEGDTPSLSTIKRIIKRNGLVVQKRKRYVRCKSKKRYTLLNPIKVNEVHQMDFVGPRYIKGYGRISSLNLIDVVNSKAHIQQHAGQTMDNVIEFLLGVWTKNAIPNYLQMDKCIFYL